MGAAAADYDGDGDTDIYVTNVGANVLYRNDGKGTFSDVSGAAGVDEAGWGTAASFADLDNDGDLDLVVVNYIAWSVTVEKRCLAKGPCTYAIPSYFDAPAADHIFRNNGDGTFTDVSEKAGLNLVFGNGLGVAVADFDGDGQADIFVANDMMHNQLWHNRGGLLFNDQAMSRGTAVDENGAVKAGMGVATGDVDDDGDFDLLVVNLEAQTDTFLRNDGGYFTDTTAAAGLSTVSRRYTRFGVVLADFDNDGVLDVYEANGGILPSTSATDDDVFAEPNALFRGTREGRFEPVDPPGGTMNALVHTSRGVAVGDLDDDGGLDLVVVNRDAPVYLLKNRVAGRGNWVRFRVLTAAGSDAVDAVVSAGIADRRVYRRVQPAGSYLASSDPRVHYGLGDTASVTDVRVRWPDGNVESFGDFQAGQTVELRRGEGGS